MTGPYNNDIIFGKLIHVPRETLMKNRAKVRILISW